MAGNVFMLGVILLVGFRFIDGSVVRNCRDVQRKHDISKDGEYCISIDGSESEGQLIFCHGMDTYAPSAYLTLPKGPEENFSSTSKQGQPNCRTGTIKYEKIALDLDEMVVNSWDVTYTIMDVDVTGEECDCQPLFGRAFNCEGSSSELVKVDLRDTGFYIPDTVQWTAYGWTPVMNLQQSTKQQIVADCTGYCGGCEPRVDGQSLYLGKGLRAKTMPIAYDKTMDTRKCQL